MNKQSKFNYNMFLIVFTMLLLSVNVFTQQRTVGLLEQDSTLSFAGYTLFGPIGSTSTYLIDKNGNLVRSWSSSYRPGQAVMLLPNGNLLRTEVAATTSFNAGGAAGRVELFAWDGTLTWTYEHFSSTYRTHHDIEYLPNGNVLLISWELKSSAEAIAAGRNPANISNNAVWPEKIIEVQPTGSSGGTIVWEWHVWDHLIQDYDATKANYGTVAQHPELLDLNFGSSINDWLHVNSVRYNPQRDEILISSHGFDEIWIIDHSTTTTEAAGHTGGRRGKGGDLLYRWGNPQAYRLGTSTDEILYGQHDARWIDEGLPGAGDIMIFNNGAGSPSGNYSSVVEIVPPIAVDSSYIQVSGSAFGPASPVWSYAPQSSTFYAMNISGATRMPNGNTLACLGTGGKFIEITPSEQSVWTYVNPVTATGILTQGQTPTNNLVFKVYRYAPDYAGFVGRDLTPSGPIELYPTAVDDQTVLPNQFHLDQNYPNPFNPSTKISWQSPVSSWQTLKVYDVLSKEIATLVDEYKPAGNYEVMFDASNLTSGVYFYKLETGGFTGTKKMILLK